MAVQRRVRKMPEPVPNTGLVRGQASKIARIHRLSVQHVLECARGNRQADERLARTIEDYRQRNLTAASTMPAA